MKNQDEKRSFVLQQVIEGKMTAGQAAASLGLAKRHVFRLKQKFQNQGLSGLVHQNTGRLPKHTIPQAIRDRVIALAKSVYLKASWIHLSELLSERDEIVLSPKTIGRILKAAEVENVHTHRAARRRRSRERKPQEGMLSQWDASPHDWLEGRGPKMSLHGSIDDATGKVQGLYFRLQEDTMGYLHVLDQVVMKFGVPEAFYSDRHTIFFSPKTDKLSVEEQLAGVQVKLTQFGSALKRLKIQHIPARSPQAKGRAERLWGTLQHRLVIELRLAGISTMEEANAFLPGFIERFNAKFSVTAKETKVTYRPAPSRQELDQILCLRFSRSASQGSTISFEGQRYFLLDPKRKVVALRPGGNVIILKHLDGSQTALYQERTYALKALMTSKPSAPSSPAKPKQKRTPSMKKAVSPDSWKKGYSAKARLISAERKRISQDTPELSTREWETYSSLAFLE